MAAVAFSALRAFADQAAPVEVTVLEVGSEVQLSLFSDSALSTPLANPVTSDATGSLRLWLDDSGGAITEVDLSFAIGDGAFRVTVPVR